MESWKVEKKVEVIESILRTKNLKKKTTSNDQQEVLFH